MIKNVFSVAKKEATNYSNVVTLTANTGISLIPVISRQKVVSRKS